MKVSYILKNIAAILFVGLLAIAVPVASIAQFVILGVKDIFIVQCVMAAVFAIIGLGTFFYVQIKGRSVNHAEEDYYYFPIEIKNFYFLYFITLGWYRLFWWYKTWTYIKQRKNDRSWPWLRCLFPIFFYHKFVRDVNALCAEKGVPGIKNPESLIEYYIYLFILTFIAAVFGGVILGIFGFLNSAQFDLILTLTFVFLLLRIFVAPLKAINRLNDTARVKTSNHSFAFVVLMLLASTTWIKIIAMGAFIIQSDATKAQNFYDAGAYRVAFPSAVKASNKGDANAQYILGELLFHGYGVEKDPVAGLDWLQKSAEQNNIKAQESLGMIYRSGENGVELDYAKSVYWYEKAVKQGSAFAANDLGYLYGHGLGVAKDLQKEQEMYVFAANHGDDYAMYNLGFQDMKAKKYSSAVAWFQKAVNVKYPNRCALHDLGLLYAQGNGIEKNEKKAKELLTQSAVMLYLNYSHEVLKDERPTTRPKKEMKDIIDGFVKYQYEKYGTHNPHPSVNKDKEEIITGMSKKLEDDCWG